MKYNLLKNSFISFLFFVFINANAQLITFQKTFHYNADDVGVTINTIDSGYVTLLNHNQLQSNSAVCLIKIDKYADTIWIKHLQSLSCQMESTTSLIQTSDSGFLFLAILFNPCSTPVAIKTDKYGNYLWHKEGVFGYNIHQTYDGGYCISGGNEIEKYDSNFNLQWTYWYGGALDNGSFSLVKQLTDSSYAVYGTTRSFAAGGTSDQDIFICKVSKNGNFLWGKSYGSIQIEGANDFIQTPDGGFLLLGATRGFGAGGADILIIKTDSIGNVLWNKTYGGIYEDLAGMVRKSSGSLGYVFSGLSNGMESTYFLGIKTFLFKVDINGSHQWGRMYGDFGQNSVYDDKGTSLSAIYDAGFLLSGFSSAFGQGNTKDVWLIKTDALGFSGCNETTIAPTITNPSLIVSSGGSRYNLSFSFPPASIQVSNTLVQNVFLCSSNIPVSVNEEEETKTDLKLYPNPSTGIFTLQKETDAKATMVVYDVLGNQCLKLSINEGEGTKQIDLTNFAKGIYHLQLTEGDKVYSQKIVLH